jgi:hypothetical protein
MTYDDWKTTPPADEEPDVEACGHRVGACDGECGLICHHPGCYTITLDAYCVLHSHAGAAFGGNVSESQRHSEDLANEAAGKEEAAASIDEFFERHKKAFKALVKTYSDREAEELLAEMREKFWAANPAGRDLSSLTVERKT